MLQGFTYDHVELNSYINGKSTNTPFTGIKGTIFPVFYGEYKHRSLELKGQYSQYFMVSTNTVHWN